MARSAGGKKKETQLSRRKFRSCGSSGLRKFTLYKPFHWDHKTKAGLRLKQVWKGLNNTGVHYAAVIDRHGTFKFFFFSMTQNPGRSVADKFQNKAPLKPIYHVL